jgi:hypothetical protein
MTLKPIRKPPQSRCPNGHRPPIVQKIDTDDGVWYVCTRCGLEWRSVRYEFKDEHTTKFTAERQEEHDGRRRQNYNRTNR